eukprot:gene118-161_t
MANKNKLSVVLEHFGILMIMSVFLVVFFGCRSKAGMNSDSPINASKGCTMNDSMKENVIICSSCEDGCRYLFKLPATKSPNLFLVCEVCTSVWEDPNKLKWDDVSDTEKLNKDLKLKNHEYLFEDARAATLEEISQTRWVQLAKTNLSIVKKNTK